MYLLVKESMCVRRVCSVVGEDGCASFYVCKNSLKLEELYQWGEKLKRIDSGR